MIIVTVLYLAGALIIIARINNVTIDPEYSGELIIAGWILIIGATISVSAIKRNYYILSKFTIRSFLEIVGFILILFLVLGKNNQKYNVAVHPATHVIIPLIVIFYYIVCVFKKKKIEYNQVLQSYNYENLRINSVDKNNYIPVSLNEMVERKYLGKKIDNTDGETSQSFGDMSLNEKITIIERLAKLKEAGHITEQEFNTQKMIIMK